MARARRGSAQRLRHAVEALPRHTKLGMLRGIQSNRVIVGSYTDKRGGVCPMLAAHRNGGRTDFASFARAWDAFTGAKKPRRASMREVRTLMNHLEVALISDGVAPPGSVWDEEPVAPTVGWPNGSLADEVREVKRTRRRLAEAEAQESEITVEELLAGTYAEVEEARTEQRAHGILDEPRAPGALDAPLTRR